MVYEIIKERNVMKVFKNLLAGLAGALTLNILHEIGKRTIKDAPRVDLVGEEALSNVVTATGHIPPMGKKLFAATLGADVGMNTFYYAMIGQGRNKHLLLRGAALGLAAGFGALSMTKPLGLNDEPVNKTLTTKVLTVAWYLAGGLVTALVIQGLRSEKE